MAVPQAADQTADAVQIALLREAGPGRRAALARSLSASVIALSRAAIRRRMPGASEQEVLLRFVEVHYGRELARRVRAYLDARSR